MFTFRHQLKYASPLLILLVLVGCQTTRYIYQPDELNTLLQGRLDADSLDAVIVPFQANAEMKAFAQRITMKGQGTNSKCKRLVEGILNQSQLNVRYSKLETKTAIDLYYEGQGNCLAYTNLFVALARSVGIRAFYVDASLLVSGVEEKQGMIVNNGHICVAVYAEPELLFIDFTKKVSKHIVGYKFIDDAEAIAHFYNNVGYEKRKIGQQKSSKSENLEGIDEFLMATRIYPDFYRAYNNLGVAYQQLGNNAIAVQYYHKAIAINPEFGSAYSNLGVIHYQKKDLVTARKYFRKAIKYVRQNHFNYYYLGMIEMKNDNFKESQKMFGKAIKLKDDFHLARIALSQLYRQMGETDKSQEELQKVIRAAPENKKK